MDACHCVTLDWMAYVTLVMAAVAAAAMAPRPERRKPPK